VYVIGYSFYGLFGYTLPLDKWIDAVKITPYFYLEKNVQNDTLDYLNVKTFWWGLNVKPKPFLTPKAEFSLFLSYENGQVSDMKAMAGQMAVSF
jgi:hypothetical protein